MNISNISLIIVTCKKYEDVINLLFLNKYFKDLLNFGFADVILTSDDKNQNFDQQVVTKFCYSDVWGERIVEAASLSTSEYSLVLLDDFIPVDYIQCSKIINLIEEISTFDCIYLSHILKLSRNSDSPNINSGFFKVRNDTIFSINTGPAIWSNKTLKSVYSNVEDPWAWEAFSSFLPKNKFLKIYSPSSKKSEIYSYTPETGGVVYRGSFVVSSLNKTGISNERIQSIVSRPKICSVSSENRSLYWKVRFLKQGVRMLGFRVSYFIFYSIKSKFFNEK